MTEKILYVSTSPHIRANVSVRKIMWSVVIALIPATIGAVYFFGTRALNIILSSVVAAVTCEVLIQWRRGKPVTIVDGSAVITGLLLALNLPQNIPLWLPVLGSVFAIAVAKHLFGGLGYNIFNPALAGRVFLLLAYAGLMTTTWETPRKGFLSLSPDSQITHLKNSNMSTDTRKVVDTITSATPLKVIEQGYQLLSDPAVSVEAKEAAKLSLDELFGTMSLKRLFIGNVGGCLGETSVLLLLIGAIFLFCKRYITWHIPFSFLAALAFCSWIFWVPDVTQPFQGYPLFHILSGGAVIGAFFMATDMVTSPVTPVGMIIFGLGAGLMTAVIRFYAGYPEGVSFSILLMNAATPLIDRHTRPKKFGAKRVK